MFNVWEVMRLECDKCGYLMITDVLNTKEEIEDGI
jgi:hypothetical protein